MHEHAFKMMGSGTHFQPVPNSRGIPRPVYLMACACGQRAFKYHSAPRVTYTWAADPAKWCTEFDHDAARARAVHASWQGKLITVGFGLDNSEALARFAAYQSGMSWAEYAKANGARPTRVVGP